MPTFQGQSRRAPAGGGEPGNSRRPVTVSVTDSDHKPVAFSTKASLPNIFFSPMTSYKWPSRT
jgi:hypothetical protein